jgi:hypothetical protein
MQAVEMREGIALRAGGIPLRGMGLRFAPEVLPFGRSMLYAF